MTDIADMYKPGPRAEPRDPQLSNLPAAQAQLGLTPEERALYERHLANLWGPGGVDNSDGSRSSLFQMSTDLNGRTYNLPTVYNGNILPPDAAIAEAQKQGLGKFPSYGNGDEAEARYNQMHQFMDRDTGTYLDIRRDAPMVPQLQDLYRR